MNVFLCFCNNAKDVYFQIIVFREDMYAAAATGNITNDGELSTGRLNSIVDKSFFLFICSVVKHEYI